MNFFNLASDFLGDQVINNRTENLPNQTRVYCYDCNKPTLHKLENVEDGLLKAGMSEGDLRAIGVGAAMKFIPGTKLGFALSTNVHKLYICSECGTIALDPDLYSR